MKSTSDANPKHLFVTLKEKFEYGINELIKLKYHIEKHDINNAISIKDPKIQFSYMLNM